MVVCGTTTFPTEEGNRMKIDRDIPIPAPPEKPRREHVPVESMEVGDSIFFPGKTRVSACATCKATSMRRNLGYNFRSAAENGGARVWRTA